MNCKSLISYHGILLNREAGFSSSGFLWTFGIRMKFVINLKDCIQPDKMVSLQLYIAEKYSRDFETVLYDETYVEIYINRVVLLSM